MVRSLGAQAFGAISSSELPNAVFPQFKAVRLIKALAHLSEYYCEARLPIPYSKFSERLGDDAQIENSYASEIICASFDIVRSGMRESNS